MHNKVWTDANALFSVQWLEQSIATNRIAPAYFLSTALAVLRRRLVAGTLADAHHDEIMTAIGWRRIANRHCFSAAAPCAGARHAVAQVSDIFQDGFFLCARHAAAVGGWLI